MRRHFFEAASNVVYVAILKAPIFMPFTSSDSEIHHLSRSAFDLLTAVIGDLEPSRSNDSPLHFQVPVVTFAISISSVGTVGIAAGGAAFSLGGATTGAFAASFTGGVAAG